MDAPQLPVDRLCAEQEARPLMWWTDTQLQMLGSRISSAWSAWTRDWVASAAPCDVNAALAHNSRTLGQANWIFLGSRGGAAAWIHAQLDVATDVYQTLFAAGPFTRPAGEEGIAQAIAKRACDALLQGLRASCAIDSCPEHPAPDLSVFQPWSGAVLVTLAVTGRPHGAVLLNGTCVRAALDALTSTHADKSRPRSRSALVPCALAVARHTLPLRVVLSPCELDLGTLESLRIGDVIPLAHGLDAPLRVMTSDDIHVCSGFLGRQGSAKAIELVRRELSADGEVPVDHP